MKDGHHKKMNCEIPAWLYFALLPAGMKFTSEERGEKLRLAMIIKQALKEHLRQHDIQNDVITEPNNFDCAWPYGSKPTEV